MAVVYSSDLNGSAVNNVVAMLEAEASDTTKLINAINDFIEGSTTTLVGKGYDAARQKLGLYLVDIQSRQSIAAELAAAISDGASSLASYMDGYAKLDDSEIDDIEYEIKSLNSKIASARQTIASINESNVDSENPVSTASYTQQINDWEATIEELDKKLEKLKHLEEADSAAFGGVQSAGEQVAKYSASVEGIRVSSISV